MAGPSNKNDLVSLNTSTFPAPPIEYAEKYTSENLRNGHALPPPPVPTKFKVFGEEYDLEGPLLQSLESVGCQQLYSSSANWKTELKKLNRSIVAAFLDLINILIESPDHADRGEKIDTIRLLFINIHHLINEYRPVQARDTLREMIALQNQEILSVSEKLRRFIDVGQNAMKMLNTTFRNVSIDESIPQPKSCFNLPDSEIHSKKPLSSHDLLPSSSSALSLELAHRSPEESAFFLRREKEFLEANAKERNKN